MLKYERFAICACYVALFGCAALPITAHSQAVADLNAEVGVGGGWISQKSDSVSSETFNAAAVARLNVPVYKYLGAYVEANAGVLRDTIDLHNQFFPPSSIVVRGSLAGAAGGVFLRDPQWGKLGASWSVSSERDKFSADASGPQEPDRTQRSHAQRWGANAEAYLGNFTVGGAKQWPKPSGDFAPRFPLILDAAWYGEPNLRTSINYQTLSGLHVYGVALAWSPVWIERRLQLAASATTSRYHGDGGSASPGYSVGASISYFFTPGLDLKQRDRAWR